MSRLTDNALGDPEGIVFMGHIVGEGRGQSALFPLCLEDLIPADHACRVIDAFVDSLDMAALGFVRSQSDGGAFPCCQDSRARSFGEFSSCGNGMIGAGVAAGACNSFCHTPTSHQCPSL